MAYTTRTANFAPNRPSNVDLIRPVIASNPLPPP